MKRRYSLRRYVHLGAFAIIALALALPTFDGNAAQTQPYQPVQGQTKEPPVFGEKKVPPPPPPPPKIIQQPIPVPALPGPAQPPAIQPSPIVQPGIIGSPMLVVDPPTPALKLQVRVASAVPSGQEIEYHMRVQNTSSAAAHHVLVRNPLPSNARFVSAQPEPSEKSPDVVWSFGSIAPGESREIVLVLAPTDTNDVKNCARVQFEHGQCVTTHIAKALPADTGTVKGMDPAVGAEPPQGKAPPKVSTGTAKLSVKMAGPKQQFANLPAKYQITVVNTGDGMAANLLITAFLPDKASFVSATDNGRFHFNQVAWLLGDLAPGAAKTVQFSYRAAAAGEVCIKVGALADLDLRTETETCTKFEGISPLLVETTAQKKALTPGGQTSYRLFIHNIGNANLSNVQVQVLVPRELMLVRATGDSVPPTPDKLPPATAEGLVLTYAPLKELKVGEKKSYEVYVQAVEPGEARWRITVSADQLTLGALTEEDAVSITRLSPQMPRAP